MGFASLQRLKSRRSAWHGRSPARHVPPSGFDYPLDGLLPSKPCRSYFIPAALLGFALRSFLLAIGNRAVSDSEEPTYRSLICIPLHVSAGAGLTSCGFWALTQPTSPWRPDVCLVRRPLVAPVGFTLPGSFAEALTGISPDLLSRAWPAQFNTAPSAPQSLDQLLLHLTRPLSEAVRGRMRHPHRVPAPS